jgi:hypothetical protein
MQFLQEFSIEQGVIFTQTELILGFVWGFSRNGGLYVPGLERLLSLKKGWFGRGVSGGAMGFFRSDGIV